MQSDDNSKRTVLSGDIVYSPATGRLYTVVAVGISTEYTPIVTYARLGGNGVCFSMPVNLFKDGRFIELQEWQLEQAVSKYVGAIKNAANEENV